MHAYSDWYYYMVMNPVDRIQTVWIRLDPHILRSGWIRILPDPEKTPDIRPDPDPDPVHLYCTLLCRDV